jgi:ATP-dependent helicase/nuclease subunit B
MTTRPTLLFDAALLEPYLGPALAGRDWLLLTPNRRLASRIRGAVVARSGMAVAAAAPVLAQGDWLEQLWRQLQFGGGPAGVAQPGDLQAEGCWVLSAAQELYLWEEAVRASNIPLLRPGQAAEQAAAAYRVLAAWRQLPLEASARAEFEHNPDSRAFAGWLDRFEQLCAARGCIASAQRDVRIAAAVRAGQLVLPKQVLGIGFDDLPPLQRAILDAVPTFVELDFPDRQVSAACVGADTFEEQLQAAALWVRQQLERDPAGPFAIVVPDLAQQRGVVERALLEIVTPEALSPSATRELPPLNFSAGEPLAQTPLVRGALQLLELAQPYQERQDLLELLQSPFHAGDQRETACAAAPHSEHVAAALAAVCELRSQRIGAAQLRQLADGIAQRSDGWSFAAALQQLAERARRDRWSSARYTAAHWTTVFREILDIFGWPGRRTLDSVEYQQHEQLQQALLQFAQFDRILDGNKRGALDFNAALQRLRQMLQAQVFQPQTPDLPLQVLGVLEAGGLQFKGLWLCDMGDDRWPPAPAPQPLIPRDLQRRLRMPRCDAQREFDIAARLGHSLLANAEQVVVSYQREREEVERSPSPLFQALPQVDLADLLGGEPSELAPLWREIRRQRSRFALEVFEPGAAPALSAGESARGGSGLFKAQGDCPFQAFARLRLRAEPLPTPVVGLDGAERGNLLHAALEWLWRELGDHAALLALDSAQQTVLAGQAAAQAVAQLQRLPQLATRLGPRFAALEQRRLAQLLDGWLEVERERGAFSVAALEEKKDATFAGLQLRLRVDRIDRLPDGRLLLIDYKSKALNCSPDEWLGERPDEPQLPLYSILWEEEHAPAAIAGIAFAQVRLEKPRLVGVGDAAAPELQSVAQLESPASDWNTLRQQWRAVLEGLATEFIEGCAEVNPKKPSTCTYCALAPVCRIAHEEPARLAVEAESNDG